MLRYLFILAATIGLIYSQATIEQITYPNEDVSVDYSSVVVKGLETHFFWTEGETLYHNIKTTDAGWAGPVFLDEGLNMLEGPDIQAILGDDGTIVLSYKKDKHYIRHSTDGRSWTEPLLLPLGGTVISKFGLSRIFSNASEYWFMYSKISAPLFTPKSIIYRIRTNDLNSWSGEIDTIFSKSNTKSGSANILHVAGKLLAIFEKFESPSWTISKIEANNIGENWNGETNILTSESRLTNINAQVDVDGKIWVTFEKLTSIDNEELSEKDIYYISSSDNGETWTSPVKFTDYDGVDQNSSMTLKDGKPYICFSSPRINEYYYSFCSEEPTLNNECYPDKLFEGTLGESEDTFTPPVIFDYNISFITDFPHSIAKIQTTVYDNNLSGVKLVYTLDGNSKPEIVLNDDGTGADDVAGDNVHTGVITNLYLPDENIIEFQIKAEDPENVTLTRTDLTRPFNSEIIEKYLFKNNDINLPFDNKGVLADVEDIEEPYGPGAEFDGITFLYSAGFWMSGISTDGIWANGVYSASDFLDFSSGLFDQNQEQSIYIVKSTDPPFGESWIDWAYAVNIGADFYDGNGNGVYDPVDLNNNGIWDPDEDKPTILGEITAFIVYSDKLPGEFRKFNTEDPKGINIGQTIWMVAEFDNVIFIKYKISNTGAIESKFNDVYFAAIADPDLGDPDDDLVGCDIDLHSGFIYNYGPDDRYNDNPPSMFTTLLQGPVVSFPGVTFEDLNSNGIYDGSDVALDTAYVKNKNLGTEMVLGSANLGMTSFTELYQSNSTHNYPVSESELRNYLLGGRDEFGNSIHVSTWALGNGNSLGSDTLNILPQYMYSGDPVAQIGWLNTIPTDHRMLVSTGPFTLEEGKPVELIYAYTIDKGSSALNSIEVVREIVNSVKANYPQNYTYVGVEEDNAEIIPDNYVLYQNYPNPFNPTTTIKYSVASVGENNYSPVRLIVYNLLGQQVATLVNERQTAGNYEVKFDASSLASGIYLYKLQAGEFSCVKKLMLLK